MRPSWRRTPPPPPSRRTTLEARIRSRPNNERRCRPITPWSAKFTALSPETMTQGVWTKLHQGGDNVHRRVERWMSISEREGKCGVEVAAGRRPSLAGVDHSPERRYRRPGGRRKRFWGNLSVTP